MVGAALGLRHDMIDGEVLERKRLAAAVAEALLLSEEVVLVFSSVVGRDVAKVGALRDVRAVDAPKRCENVRLIAQIFPPDPSKSLESSGILQ